MSRLLVITGLSFTSFIILYSAGYLYFTRSLFYMPGWLYCSIKKKRKRQIDGYLYLKEVQFISYVQYCILYCFFKENKK